MSDEEKTLDTPIVNEMQDDEAPIREAPADTLRILEALIFASDELLTPSRLKAILPNNPGGREIGAMVEKINRQLQKERHPFEIVEIGGGYQFKTVAFYHPWVRQIFQEKAAKRLSIQALECLSIIAYRQPLSKAEIEAIRGVISDGAMKTLLEKRLITITGRSEKPGRPLLYGTTPEFLHYFGLNKLADLPNIEEFEAMVREKIEHLPIDELAAAQVMAKAGNGEAPIEEVEWKDPPADLPGAPACRSACLASARRQVSAGRGNDLSAGASQAGKTGASQAGKTGATAQAGEDGGKRREPILQIVKTVDDTAVIDVDAASLVITPDDEAIVEAAENSFDLEPESEESQVTIDAPPGPAAHPDEALIREEIATTEAADRNGVISADMGADDVHEIALLPEIEGGITAIGEDEEASCD